MSSVPRVFLPDVPVFCVMCRVLGLYGKLLRAAQPQFDSLLTFVRAALMAHYWSPSAREASHQTQLATPWTHSARPVCGHRWLVALGHSWIQDQD